MHYQLCYQVILVESKERTPTQETDEKSIPAKGSTEGLKNGIKVCVRFSRERGFRTRLGAMMEGV